MVIPANSYYRYLGYMDIFVILIYLWLFPNAPVILISDSGNFHLRSNGCKNIVKPVNLCIRAFSLFFIFLRIYYYLQLSASSSEACDHQTLKK